MEFNLFKIEKIDQSFQRVDAVPPMKDKGKGVLNDWTTVHRKGKPPKSKVTWVQKPSMPQVNPCMPCHEESSKAGARHRPEVHFIGSKEVIFLDNNGLAYSSFDPTNPVVEPTSSQNVSLDLFLWNQSKFEVLDVLDHAQITHFKLRDVLNNFSFTISGIYGSHSTAERKALWNHIEAFNNSSLLPWCLGGDFNTISDLLHHKGARLPDLEAIDDFSSCISNCNLLDCNFSGPSFTWHGVRSNGNVWRRLDRVFFNAGWADHWDNKYMHHLAKGGSDQGHPILFSSKLVVRDIPKSFRFQNMWLLREDFIQFCKESWEEVPVFGGMRCLFNKLQHLKAKLSSWNKDQFGNVFDKAEPSASPDLYEQFLDAIPSLVDQRHNDYLMCLPTEEEIKLIIWEMDPNSAAGPDGFNITFFKCCWDFIKSDVVSACQETINYGKSSFMSGSKFNSLTITKLEKLLMMPHKGFPFTYLGVPIDLGITKKSHCSFLIQSFDNKLNGWFQKNLDQAGRLVLIKHVLNTIPNYFLAANTIPKAISHLLKQKMARLWWGGGTSKHHWICWKKLCYPMEEGGLGIRDLNSLENAFSLKLWWKFYQDNGLWAKLMRAKYWRNGDIFETLTDSPVWKRISRADETASNACSFIEDGSVVWSPEANGLFSLKSAFDLCRPASPSHASFKHLWMKPQNAKVGVFTWKLFKRCLPLPENLQRLWTTDPWLAAKQLLPSFPKAPKVRVVKWLAPPKGRLKINIDASFTPMSNRGAAILRDDEGRFVRAALFLISGSTPYQAELDAAIKGVQWALSFHPLLVYETDALEILRRLGHYTHYAFSPFPIDILAKLIFENDILKSHTLREESQMDFAEPPLIFTRTYKAATSPLILVYRLTKVRFHRLTEMTIGFQSGMTIGVEAQIGAQFKEGGAQSENPINILVKISQAPIIDLTVHLDIQTSSTETFWNTEREVALFGLTLIYLVEKRTLKVGRESDFISISESRMEGTRSISLPTGKNNLLLWKFISNLQHFHSSSSEKQNISTKPSKDLPNRNEENIQSPLHLRQNINTTDQQKSSVTPMTFQFANQQNNCGNLSTAESDYATGRVEWLPSVHKPYNLDISLTTSLLCWERRHSRRPGRRQPTWPPVRLAAADKSAAARGSAGGLAGCSLPARLSTATSSPARSGEFLSGGGGLAGGRWENEWKPSQ
ncbi:unnamed protein product [Cuscuta campestris]|uniref:Endonuclease/exonuclease/phosphatase domain-containing protein n=1 Tax=Cuscuta campestris TaxID=132261 RepID=A0A484KLJ9_9ASTE|nr:unnamed protein product [Cuscuta campestris]